jgi:zinc/manganese transport system substrate-binding protein
MNLQDMLALDFMRSAFVTGACIAVAAGLVGYFVVLRNQVFATDALGHTAFTGGLGGVLVGLNVLVGVFATCVGVALAIGTLGGRGRGRDVAVGTVFAWVLGVGVLFLSLYTTSRSAGSGTLGMGLLFGSILGLEPAQAAVTSVVAVATSIALLLVARPLLFLSVDPEVAVTRGVPARALTALFMILVAVTVAESVQAVGALLIFALMVTPAAVAQNLSSRPWLGLLLSAAVALVVVWGGLVLSFFMSYPAGFFITALAFALYLLSRARRWLPVAALTLGALSLSGCGLAPQTSPSASGVVRVTAAENMWGSIAAQTAGSHAHVTSVIVNPATDPHDYEPTAADARLFAQSDYVIVNGAGYDAWAQKLLDANPVAGRRVLVISDLLGKKEGDNPHFWYSPSYVGRVIDRIASDLGTAATAAQFKSAGLHDYLAAIDAIRGKYTGTKVGATESIFVYLADATGLDLVTPSGYLNAISEGTDPTAADKATVLRQVTNHEIKVLVFNSQNSTPEVAAVVDRARAVGVPVVAVTETLVPAGATFQDWQTAQLRALLHALGD